MDLYAACHIDQKDMQQRTPFLLPIIKADQSLFVFGMKKDKKKILGYGEASVHLEFLFKGYKL